MSSLDTHSSKVYSSVLEAIHRVRGITRGEVIYRGESSFKFDYPHSSTLYRQLKEEGVSEKKIPSHLRKRQNKLINELSKYPENGNSNLERIAYYQHYITDRRRATNLLDFTFKSRIALFFACDGNPDKDGVVIVKPKNSFRELEIGEDFLPEDEIVLFEPPSSNERAQIQSGVLLHPPKGVLEFEAKETVLIKAEWKREILKRLKKYEISHDDLFDDIEGLATRQDREYAKKDTTTAQATARLHSFSRSEDDQEVVELIRSYRRLLNSPATKPYRKHLDNYAKLLIKIFTDKLKRDSRDIEAYFDRALVYQSKPAPNYDKAISDYTSALEFRPNLVAAYNNRGSAYMGTDYDKAISDFSSAIKLNPSSAGAYYNRGIAYAIKPTPNYARAILDYNEAIKLNPRYVDAYNNRGNVYATRPRPNYKRAISDYNDALKLDPNYIHAYNNRGNVYTHKPNSDYDSAILDYDKAIELDPNYARAYYNRSIAYYNKPNPDHTRAILDRARALGLNPSIEQSLRLRMVRIPLVWAAKHPSIVLKLSRYTDWVSRRRKRTRDS